MSRTNRKGEEARQQRPQTDNKHCVIVHSHYYYCFLSRDGCCTFLFVLVESKPSKQVSSVVFHGGVCVCDGVDGWWY